MSDYRLAIIRKSNGVIEQEWDEKTVHDVIKSRYDIELDKRFTKLKKWLNKDDALRCFSIAWNHLIYEFRRETIKNPKIY